jgi:flagellar biogenesis protein FliO
MGFVEQMAVVSAVLVLLASMLWVLRRRGFAALLPVKKRERRLECLERLSLGPQHTLHLVRVDEGAWLLASTPGGCSLVPSLPDQGTAGFREAAR